MSDFDIIGEDLYVMSNKDCKKLCPQDCGGDWSIYGNEGGWIAHDNVTIKCGMYYNEQ